MVDVVNLPPLPGLPDIQLADLSALPASLTTALTADDPAVLAALGSAPWGIYSGGLPVVVADTVAEVGYSKGYTISDFPVEQGAFASFDSVEQPFEGRVRLATGGSAAARQVLIDSVETVLGDLNTYDLVTPDRIYINANVTREEYKRSTPSLLEIDVGVQEIRILASSTTGQNTADPASADPVNGGTVTATPANQAQIAALGGTPITTPLPQTLGGGVNGLPVTQPSGGIGSA